MSGLHNDFKASDKDFETRFLILDGKGKYDLIDDFFTHQEMVSADHWLKGEFDENGFFSGEIRIFERREKYTFRPNRPPGKTSYGPFGLQWGFVEGNVSNSILNQESFSNIYKKLEVLGGLYVYRDNFRVLPYGRPEADFLEFEKRRNLGAGYYFFSLRRFIGYIDISREKNPKLRDKAGREGFIQNTAYREFRDDLIEFFIDIAKRYLRKSGEGETQTFREQQIEDINAKYQKQQAAAKRKNAKTKKAFLEGLKENHPLILELKDQIDALEKNLKTESERLEINYNAYNGLVEILESKRISLRELKLTKPQGVKISERQKKQYEGYQNDYFVAEESVRACIRVVEDTREKINVENLKFEFNDKFKSQIKYLEKLFSSYQSTMKESVDRLHGLLEEEKEERIDHFKTQSEPYALKPSDEKEDITAKIQGLTRLIDEQNKSIEESIAGFINHVTNLQIDVDDDFLRGWYQEQNENLSDKLSDYEELAQLGMSIEIIDHQFNVMYSQMNDAIHELDRYTRKNKDLNFVYKQLKGAFQHLEGNYKLLKPLYRTSRRTREVITGFELERYIRDFFSNEFKRYKIEFEVDNAFRDYEFFTFDSILKPIFLNIINNANYWLIPSESRKIKIECEDKEIRIMNSGERIDDSYLEDIFTLFFTRKREGRGIGLFLARKNLNSIGYNLYATNDPEYNKLKGACFVIKPLE